MPQVNDSIVKSLPTLRRFARALTGSQKLGDEFAAAALTAVHAADGAGGPADLRLQLFRACCAAWSAAGSRGGQPDSRLSARAQDALAGLDPNSRVALLLHALEGLDFDEVGAVLGTGAAEAQAAVHAARIEVASATRGKVLVIEDETFIAMDLASIVSDMGHRIIGVAATPQAAVELAEREQPDLILADIRLDGDTSGVDAVREILDRFDAVPVIFVTAYPDLLLTGRVPEPVFVIRKPYTEDQVRSAVSQAMFFASTETLAA